MRRQHGFTLIELIITVAVIALLAAIALPSYTQYVIRSKRSAAQAQMMDIANRQQQFMLANRGYADKAALETGGYRLPDDVSSSYDYSITLATGAVPGFTVTFTPKGSQASDVELTLSSEGAKTPSDKW
ncbi:prepilin-type cleavage/methylation domain-containing protein [Variovorax sp. WS11]|uniref:type IV pilin protein n=1 Tax=Variovorax sp. WS11 TaxID=1105204 RepID=UPI000D0D8C8A|nr:type IV pilin protein [Variovorax sp. WS11]NDZ12174.1 prepilin-type N-terminal cleavage/methylation domain-containing protein [Variovorax sp. WS11]PSL80383.1 prepilin-type cleavage/methylation domain-containing protein [Variovorax sp. WS11]